MESSRAGLQSFLIFTSTPRQVGELSSPFTVSSGSLLKEQTCPFGEFKGSVAFPEPFVSRACGHRRRPPWKAHVGSLSGIKAQLRHAWPHGFPCAKQASDGRGWSLSGNFPLKQCVKCKGPCGFSSAAARTNPCHNPFIFPKVSPAVVPSGEGDFTGRT